MGEETITPGFETKAAAKSNLPDDLPDATESSKEHANGTVYRSVNGKRYRLRHATWVPVLPRAKRTEAAATGAAEAAAKK
jgi:hypothetical protein